MINYRGSKTGIKLESMLSLNVIKEQVNQTWSIERIAKEYRPRTWESVFEDAQHELHDVSTILEMQERMYGMFYPLKKDIFAAFHLTPLSSVKVVILGQDPYPQSISVNGTSVPRAVGLSFSVRQEDTVPSSLQNIYTELANTVRGFVRPDHGDLREWTQQGVLLLNSCLTVKPGQPGSHGAIWLGFINRVFKAIATINPNCIYLLWGRDAQKVKPMLGERSVILEAAHPSGRSARQGFFGCNHFNQVNDILIRQGKVGINWRISSLRELHQLPAAIPIPKANPNFQPILAPMGYGASPPNLPIPKPMVGLPSIPKIIDGPSISPPSHGLGLSDLPTIPNTKESEVVETPSFRVGGALLPTLLHSRTTIPISEPMAVESKPEEVLDVKPSIPIIPKIDFGIVQPNANVIQFKHQVAPLDGLPQILF